MMTKKPMLRLISHLAVKAIDRSNKAFCLFWSYQPKVPEGIKNFKG